uniref:Glutathione S-transferase n=2 Tax=Aegilops tauschii subsp. strangulata TaxID=200361 RepID=A0A453QGM6_AEGTS
RRSRRGRPEAAGHVGEPGRPARATRSQHQGRQQLRVPRGGLRQQERAAPPLQPRPQDGAGADPRRQARLRVDGHHTVPRRGVRRRRPPRPPPGRPLRARRRPLLGRIHRRHAQLLKAMYQASWSKTEEEKVEGKKKVAAALKTLDGALRDVAGGKPFFGGDAPGYVDTVLGGLLAWARSMDVINGVKTIDPVTMPLLAAWADRFGALDAVEAVMPDVNRLVEFSLSLTT